VASDLPWWRVDSDFGSLFRCEAMRAGQWVITAIGGVTGFAAIAIALIFAITPRHSGEAAAGVAAIGGPFTLIDDTGATVTDKTLAGKPYAIYFGLDVLPRRPSNDALRLDALG
jgi:hypothetical protein